MFLDEYPSSPDEVAVVICHGFFQHRRTKRFRKIASCFASKGYGVIVFDFRGHGQSSGLYTYGDREALDLISVLEFVRSRYSKIAVLGFSLGASSAIRALSCKKIADALICVSAVADPNAILPWNVWWPGAIRSWWNQIGVWRSMRSLSLHYGKSRAVDSIDRLSPIPILFIHATKDWLIGPWHSEKLYHRAGEPKKIHLVNSRCHAEEFIEEESNKFTLLCHEWIQGVFSDGDAVR